MVIELASCARCGHTGHRGAEGQSLRCLWPGCPCPDWVSRDCPGCLEQAEPGKCPGGFAGRHSPYCPDYTPEHDGY